MQETRSYDRVDVPAMDNVLVFFYSIEIEQTKFEKLLHFMRRLNFLGFMVVEVCSQHTGTQHRQKNSRFMDTVSLGSAVWQLRIAWH